jgi:hypothetical protein
MSSITKLMGEMPKYHIPSIIVGFLLGLCILYIIIDANDVCMPQGICLYEQGEHNVTGNCKDFILLSEQILKFTEGITINSERIDLTDFGKGYQEPAEGCPKCPSVQPPICPTCPECLGCPLFDCRNELHIPNDTVKHLKNLCKETIRPNGNAAISSGCYQAQDAALELLEIKKSRFWEGESRTNYYDSIKATISNYSANTFCFLKDDAHQYGRTGVGFFLNSTMWRWNYTLNYWNVANTTKINDTDYSTYVTTESNISDNLWVQQR